MAQEIVGFKIEINGQEKVVKSLGEMKQLIKDANFELLSAQQNFGEYSKEALNAAKKVATLKDAVQEAGETAQLFDPGKKFQAFAGALNAAAGGIAAFQGALGLIGVESENVQKSLLKVQSALALSQGLSTIADSAKDFQRLASVISNLSIVQKAYNFVMYGTATATRAADVATKATAVSMRVLRGVMASLGIGALVIGVGLLVEKIIAWTSSASENEKALKKQAEATRILNSNIDNEISLLTALGGQEDKIALKRKEQINNNLNDLRSRLKTVGKLNEEEQSEFRKLTTELKVIDINETNRKNTQAQEQAKKRKDNYKQEVEDYKEKQKEIEEATKSAYDKAKQTANEVFLNEIQDEKTREEVRVALQYEQDKAEILQSKATQEAKNAALLALDSKYKQDLAAIKKTDDEKKVKESEDELTALLDALIKEEELNMFYLERDKKLKEEYNKADLEATKELQQKKFEAVNAGIDLIAALAGKSEVVGNILYTIQKAIEIGKIISSTSSAIAQVSASTAAVPAILPPGVPNPAFPAAVAIGAKKIAGLKISAAASIASIVASSIAKFKGGSGGTIPTQGTAQATSGGSAPITPSAPLVNTRTQLDSTSIQRLGSATNRSYVLESDVTNSQERIRRINRAARLS